MPWCLLLLFITCATAGSAQTGLSRQSKNLTAVIKGRCVAAENGTTLPSCTVQAVVVAPSTAKQKLPRSRQRPASVTTDADGNFELHVHAQRGHEVQLRITHPDRCPQSGARGYLEPGKTYRVQAALRRGMPATGVVVGPTGKPLVARVQLGPMPPLRRPLARTPGPIAAGPLATGPLAAGPVAPGLTTPGPVAPNAPQAPPAPNANQEPGEIRFATRETKRIESTTDAAGRFEIDAVPPGIYSIRVWKRGFFTDFPKELIVGHRSPPPAVTIRAAETTHIAGRVVDPQGVAMPGVHLAVKNNRYGPSIEAQSGPDGRFKIYRTGPCPDRAALVIAPDSPCMPRAQTKPFAWGKTGVRVEVRRLPTATLRVVAADTGKPIERFAVRAYPVDSRTDVELSRLRYRGRHPDGLVRIEDVRLGPQHVVAIPTDPTRLPVRVTVNGAFGMPQITVRVPRLIPMQLSLLDASGKPAPGIRVRVIQRGNNQTHRRNEPPPVLDPRARIVRARSSNPDDTFDTIVYEATTDAVGQCVVFGIRGSKAQRLTLWKGAISRGTYPIEFRPRTLSKRIQLPRRKPGR